MQSFKLELKKSERVELYIANIIIGYRRQFEILQQRLTVIVDRLRNTDTAHHRSPTLLAELIEKQNRIIHNITNLNVKLEESRARYAEIQSSLSTCDSIIENTKSAKK